ncbi:MAG: 30S ribosomal protein S6 [Bacilli bacterium]
MKKYEIMFIVRPDLENEANKAVADTMKTVLTDKGATILEAKEMGQRELAYEIKKYKTGYYYLYVIESKDAEAISEFDRLSLISEDILRHLIIKVEK